MGIALQENRTAFPAPWLRAALLLAAFCCQPAWAQVPAPGTVFKDCEDCPEMVVIPAGSFFMGSPKNEPSRSRGGEEEPVNRVKIAAPFALAKTEVTQGQWKVVMGNKPDLCKGVRR